MSKPRTLDPPESTSRTAVPATQRIVPLAYRVDEVAALIGMSGSKVWSLIREGRLPARRLDGSTIVRHEDLTAFIDALPLVRQLVDAPDTPPPPPPSPVPKPLPPPPTAVPARRPEVPPELRRPPVQPRVYGIVTTAGFHSRG